MGLIRRARAWFYVPWHEVSIPRGLIRRWRTSFIILSVAFFASLLWFSSFADHQHAKDARTNVALLATNAKLRATATALALTQAHVDYAAKTVAHRLAVVAWDACLKRNEQSERVVWILASQGIVTVPVVEKCPPKPAPLPPFVPPAVLPPTDGVTPTTRRTARHVTTTTRLRSPTTRRVQGTTTTSCPGRNEHSCAACSRPHHNRNC